MNPNRQNNRCVTPVGAGFVGRPGGRPVGTGCGTAVPAAGCVVTGGIIGSTNNCGSPCSNSACGPAVANDCGNPCGPAVVNDCGNPCGPVVVNDCCNPCGVIGSANDTSVGGIIIGQSGSACNRETVLNGLPVAMAYVPWQCYGNLYSLPQALKNGTLFRELDLEFAARRCN